jgi:hypothetical protein
MEFYELMIKLQPYLIDNFNSQLNFFYIFNNFILLHDLHINLMLFFMIYMPIMTNNLNDNIELNLYNHMVILMDFILLIVILCIFGMLFFIYYLNLIV